jgi:uncharacterized protein YbjT (DUF2867 family)
MFVVTGATGQLGHAIVNQLARLVPANQIVAVCRDPAKIEAALGVEVRRGDFSDLVSLSSAFEGAKQVLLVSSNAQAYGGDSLAQHRNAIAAVRDAGAERIVYTSHMAVSQNSAFPPMHEHAATEVMLRDCGMAWTALRHGFYAMSGIAMAKGMRTGAFDTAADGPASWTAHADLAEADARILIQTSRENGPTPPLTGSEALDFSDLAEIASDVLGKPIVRRIHSDDEMRAKLASQGLPEVVINIFMGYYVAARNGEFLTVDPALEKLLGRPPIRMRELIADKVGRDSA